MVEEDFKGLPEIIMQKDLRARYAQDKPLVEEFCKKYGVELVKVSSTEEASKAKHVLEPMYFFSDDTGGYTRDGLEASLKEE